MMNKLIFQAIIALSLIVVSSCINDQVKTESQDIANEVSGSLTETIKPSSTQSPLLSNIPTSKTSTPTSYPTATLSGLEIVYIDCETTTYTVVYGDTLTYISDNFDIPINEIKNWNGMVTEFIYEGHTLVLPLCDWDYVYELLGKENDQTGR